MAAQRGTVQPGSIIRPPAGADWLSKPTHAKVGLGLAAVGIMVAVIALIGAIVKATLIADDGSGDTTVLSYDAWTFGVATAGLGTVKLGIGVILLGIIRWLWIRVDTCGARRKTSRGSRSVCAILRPRSGARLFPEDSQPGRPQVLAALVGRMEVPAWLGA